MKPSDSNNRILGSSGSYLYKGILKRRDSSRYTSLSSKKVASNSGLPSYRIMAAVFVQRIRRIVTRAFLKAGWWSDTTHHEISNLLTRLQIFLNELVKTAYLSVFCRWSAARISQVAQVNGQFSALLRNFHCNWISGHALFLAVTWWRVI